MSILEVLDCSLTGLLMVGIIGMALGVIIQGAWEAFAPDGKCVWNFCNGFYRTDCGYRTPFNEEDATPEENGIAYCPYCGRVLKTEGR